MNINFSFRAGLLSISGKIGLQVDRRVVYTLELQTFDLLHTENYAGNTNKIDSRRHVDYES